MFDDLLCNGLTINALRSFLLVAEKGGYSAAANRDLSTAANLKNRIAGLTDPFHGVPLFQPKGRSVELTSKGKELQRVATQVLQLLEDFQKSCLEERHLIRIGGGQALFGEMFLPQWEKIRQKLGKYRFQFNNLRTAEAIHQIKEQRLDFAIVRPDAAKDEPVECHLLAEIKFDLCVPRKLFKRVVENASLADVPCQLPMATVAGDGQFRHQLDTFGRKNKFKFRILIECSSHSQVCDFVKSGTVAAILPSSLAASLPDAIAIPMQSSDGFQRAAALVWLPQRMGSLQELEFAKRELIKLMDRTNG